MMEPMFPCIECWNQHPTAYVAIPLWYHIDKGKPVYVVGILKYVNRKRGILAGIYLYTFILKLMELWMNSYDLYNKLSSETVKSAYRLDIIR